MLVQLVQENGMKVKNFLIWAFPKHVCCKLLQKTGASFSRIPTFFSGPWYILLEDSEHKSDLATFWRKLFQFTGVLGRKGYYQVTWLEHL